MLVLERFGERGGAHGVRHGLAGADTLERTCLRPLLRGMQAVAGNETAELQPREQPVQFRFVRRLHAAGLRRKIDRRFAADRRQIIGHIGVFFSLLELCAELFLQLVQMCIDAVQRAVVEQQLRGRLRADARDARNVVGAVTHQRLQVDQMDGIKAIFLPEAGRVIVDGNGLRHLGRDKLDRHVLVDELQRIPVAGDDHAVPVFAPALPADRADDVVSFPTLTGENGDAHGAQHVLHDRHLHGQLLRHRVARGLIAVIGQMAERGRFEIECNAQCVRLLVIAELFENIQKAIDGVCKQAVPGRKRAHAIVGAVDNAVAVENHQLHRQNSFDFLQLVYHTIRLLSRNASLRLTSRRKNIILNEKI